MLKLSPLLQQIVTSYDACVGGLAIYDEAQPLVLATGNFYGLTGLERGFAKFGCPYDEIVDCLAGHGQYGDAARDAIVADRMRAMASPHDDLTELRSREDVAISARLLKLSDGHILTLMRPVTTCFA